MNTATRSFPFAPSASRLRPWLARAASAVWRSLEASGQARASRHLLDFAEQCEAQQPELAKELRAAAHHHAAA